MNTYEKILIGFRLNFIKRQLDVIMLDFEDGHGEKVFVHIQCFFRAIRKGEILFSSSDMYQSISQDSEFNFDWTEPGTTVFDESLIRHQRSFENTVVTKTDWIGKDFEIHLSSDIILQVMIDSVQNEEMYRLFNEKQEILVV
jgi:hypothetical protein